MKRLTLGFALFLSACGGGDDDNGAPDLAKELAVVPGLTVLEQRELADGRSGVVADFTQLVDHDNPAGPTFAQRVVIYHRDAAAPTVLNTQGYNASGSGISEPTAIVGGNEVQVEHRFFGTSKPETVDWSKLSMAQAAADHHAVIEALRVYYSGSWISTGASKGGVAALEHRSRYPNDVSGTVAYVAPHAEGLADPRFATFVNALGEDTCGAELRKFQKDVLTDPRRSQLAGRLATALAQRSYTVETLGADRILEFTTVETPFTFWQYGGEGACDFIPDVAADSDNDVLNFIDSTNRFVLWSDQGIAEDQAYWLAVVQEQGYPGDTVTHLDGLLRYDDQPVPPQMITVVSPLPAYDPAPMQTLDNWVATQASQLVLVYGERDPWSAGAFTVSGTDDTSSHTVALGNHLSLIGDLPEAERMDVANRIRAWVGQ